jgi:gliding motility-associated-like protein
MDSANSQTPIVWPIGNTTYQVVVQDTFGSCSDTIEHLLAIVTEFDAGFQMPDTICINGGTITCIPNIGGGVYSGVGIIDSINGVFDPSISGEGTFPINYLVSSPTGNCMNDSTINIEVIPATDPSFSIKEFCLGSAADTLVPVTPGGSWSGLGMVDSVSGIFDPSIGSGLPVGDYPITYSISAPCIIDTTMIIRIIKPYTFVLTNAIVPVCFGDTADLNLNYTLSSDPLQGNGPVSATWFSSDGLVDSAGIFNANAVPDDYTISLTIAGEDGTCGSTQTFIVRITPVDYATAAQELAYCSDNQQAWLFIDPWLFGAGVTFTQTPIAPLGATDTLNIVPYCQNGEFDATIQGVGQWALEMTYVNVYGCTGITNDTIYVVDTPDAPTIDDASYCEGDSVFLSATGVTQDSIYWHGNALLTDTIGVGNPTYWNIAPDPSLGDVFVWVTENNWVCVSPKVLYKLPLKPSPVATFAMTYQDSNGAQAVTIPHTDAPIYGLTPLSVSFNSFNAVASDTLIWYHHWEKDIIDPQEVNTSNSSSVMWNYTLPNLDKDFLPIDGTEAYINQLVVINEFGCVDTAQAEIYSIASEQFYNVFTPNDDGINDIFTVPVFGLTDYKVQIFNRWGKKVYEWTDPEGGWSGEDQPNGVYFYVVTGINNDAQKSEYKQQGSVTLMGSEN